MNRQRSIRFLLFALIVISVDVTAQRAGNYWSSIPCHVGSSDSAFMLSVMKKSWSNYFRMPDKQKPTVWESESYFHYAYNVTSASAILKDTMSILKRFNSWYELCLMWNRSIDTFHIMSFTPARGSPENFPGISWHDQWFDQYRISLHDQLSGEKPESQIRFKNCLFASFSKKLNSSNNQITSLTGDTLLRTVYFQVQENSEDGMFFPHATIYELVDDLTIATLTKVLPSYSDSNCTKRILDPLSNNKWYWWDSTNQIEDPNHPGNFILAPLKVQAVPKNFVIIESWQPCSVSNGNHNVVPQFSYSLKVRTYGIILITGLTYWFREADFNAYMASVKYNMTPYNEIFRGERFRSMHVQRDWITK